MTVQQLIERLQQCDPLARVMLADERTIFNAMPLDVCVLNERPDPMVVIADHRILERHAACN